MSMRPYLGSITALVFGLSILTGTPHPASAQWLRTVSAFGYNNYGQLGDGTSTSRNAPVSTSGLGGVVAVAGGDSHSLALEQNGTILAWGFNGDGELGNGTTTDSNVPVPVSNLTNAIAVAAGYAHSLAVSRDGTVWAWGWNFYGHLGNGTNTNTSLPTRVTGLTNVVAVAAGYAHSLALRRDGTVWAWGDNTAGDLGNGTSNPSPVPVPVSNLTNVVAIAAGQAWFSLALKRDGTIWAWGYNADGELGNGTNKSSSLPVLVSKIAGGTAISAGNSHALALKNDGTVWTWGYNGAGELGDTTFDSRTTPVQVTSLSRMTAIAGGGNHSLALSEDGSVWAWGDNGDGQSDDGDTIKTSAPVLVTGISGACGLAAGAWHSLILLRGEPFDLTGSGNNDLLWRNTATAILDDALMPEGANLSLRSMVTDIPIDWQVVAQPDIDGDGAPDLVWQNEASGDVTYYIMDGTGFTGAWNYIARGLPPGWKVVAAADIDGDGSPDLVFQNEQTGDVTYLQVVNGKWTGTWGFLSQGINPEWKIVGAVDLFNDGNNDLVWWNSNSGDVTYFHMNHTSFTGQWDYIVHGIPTIWRVAGLADFSGDKMPDLVWQNTETADVTFLEVKAGKWTGKWDYIVQGEPTTWYVTGLR